MTFSINLLIVLSKMIGQKALRVSYNSLLGLEITITIETLKCDGQYPILIYMLAIAIIFLRYPSSLIHFLRCFHNNLSDLGANELLHFAIALINSSSKKGFHFIIGLLAISSSKSRLIAWFWAELKEE